MLTVSRRRPRSDPRRMRPGPGRRPPISGLPEIGTIARKSATADLRWLASRAPQGDGLSQISVPDDFLHLVPMRRARTHAFWQNAALGLVTWGDCHAGAH